MSRKGRFEGTSDNDIIVSRAIRSRKFELNRKHTFQTSEAAAEEVPTVVEPCEKPTPTGWSMNNLREAFQLWIVKDQVAATISYTLATSFHAVGFRLTVLVSLLIRHGPSSWNRPIILELPGYERQAVSKQTMLVYNHW